MKKTSGRLGLNRETVKHLQLSQLGDAAGGTFWTMRCATRDMGYCAGAGTKAGYIGGEETVLGSYCVSCANNGC